jgi:hypothetical protein
LAIAVETVRTTLPAGLRWIPLADGALSVVATLVWNPARAQPARDLFIATAERVSAQEGWDRTLES